MTSTIDPAAADEAGRRDALVERLFTSMIGANELASVWLGLRLHLYEALRDQGPATVAELAGRAGVDARYAREWLEQQAVAGLLDVEDAAADADTRRYRLPEATPRSCWTPTTRPTPAPPPGGWAAWVRCCPGSPASTAPARASPTPSTGPTAGGPSPTSTGPCSSTTWPAGSRAYPSSRPA